MRCFIKLETTENSLLEGVTKVIPFDNKLFILSSQGNGNVFIFDNKGSFINKISKGEGPNEILYPIDIAINQNTKTLCILDTYRTIKEYSFEGNYTKKIALNEPFLSLEILDNDILLFDPNSRSQADHYLRYLSEDNENRDLLSKPFKGKMFSLPNFFTKENNNTILISCIFTDTIYSINKNYKELVPTYILNFQGKGANETKRLKETPGLIEYLKSARENNYVTGPCDLSIINKNLFFTLGGANNYFVTYKTKDKKIKLHTCLFDGLPNNYASVGRTEDHVIFCMDMPWLIEYFSKNQSIPSDKIKEIKELCKDENDNPILLFGSF